MSVARSRRMRRCRPSPFAPLRAAAGALLRQLARCISGAAFQRSTSWLACGSIWDRVDLRPPILSTSQVYWCSCCRVPLRCQKHGFGTVHFQAGLTSGVLAHTVNGREPDLRGFIRAVNHFSSAVSTIVAKKAF